MRSVTFSRDEVGDDWEAKENGEAIAICAGEFAQHLDLEPEALTFEAVFLKTKPSGRDHFRLVDSVHLNEITLETDEYICFYESALALMGRMHKAGYRYLKVEV